MIFESPGRHYRRQAAIIARTVAEASKVWSKIDMANLDVSWAALVGELNAVIAVGQRLAAGQADRYLDELLVEQRAGRGAVLSIDPAAFSQVDVESLYSPVVAAKTSVFRGAVLDQALTAGAARLLQVVTTTTADAGRQAVTASMVAHPAIGKYSRMVRPPACSRCVLLSGKVYTLNDGFKRHPMCKCVHIPLAEDLENDLTTDPAEYFRSLSRADQDKYFTLDGAEAIRDGADIGQVVNARQGMYSGADGQLATWSGTTKRGLAGKRMAANGSPFTARPARVPTGAPDLDAAAQLMRDLGFAQPPVTGRVVSGVEVVRGPGSTYLRVEAIRPMPEQIYKQAVDRDDALRLLREFGYLV